MVYVKVKYFDTHSSLDYEFDTDAILRMEMPRGVAEYKTLFDVGCQRDFIRKIEIRRESERTAIDEGIAVVERRAVGQGVLTPVHCFIAAESRQSAIEVECLGLVADEV